jgi:hypothetical protein
VRHASVKLRKAYARISSSKQTHTNVVTDTHAHFHSLSIILYFASLTDTRGGEQHGGHSLVVVSTRTIAQPARPRQLARDAERSDTDIAKASEKRRWRLHTNTHTHTHTNTHTLSLSLSRDLSLSLSLSLSLFLSVCLSCVLTCACPFIAHSDSLGRKQRRAICGP